MYLGISALFSLKNYVLKQILFPVSHTCFGNTQMYGTRKPHQLSSLVASCLRGKRA